MRAILVAAILVTTTLASVQPAQACRMFSPLRMENIDHADVIVVGRLSHYERVADQAARERRRQQIQSIESPELRATLQNPATGYMSDYARFRIVVHETLRGEAPRTLIVTWNNSTFGEPPSMEPGDYLVALSVRHDTPPAGESRFTVTQAVCSSPFLFPADSDEAREARARLR